MTLNFLKKTGNSFLILLSFFLITTITVSAQNVTEDEFSIKAKAALAIDVETGTILYEQNSEEVLPIASITKLLSFYVIQESVMEGVLDWSDTITISKDVATLSQDLTLSNVILDEGDTYTVEELFETAVIQSANAATVAIAEAVAGTEAAFVDLMNEQLAVWGITDAKILNSTGLNNEDIKTAHYPGSGPNDENELSAKELAIIARHLIQDYPKILTFTGKASATFNSKSGGPSPMHSTNWLLPGMPYENPSVDGLKTGTTILAGPSFVGTAIREEQRIITVVLNAQDDEETPDARFSETNRLIDYAYDNWSYQEVLASNEVLPDVSPIKVTDGKVLEVPVVTKEAIRLLVPNDPSNQTFDYQLTLKDKQKEALAPIAKNKELGSFTLTATSDYLEATDQPKFPFYAKEDVEKANFFVRIWRKLFD